MTSSTRSVVAEPHDGGLHRRICQQFAHVGADGVASHHLRRREHRESQHVAVVRHRGLAIRNALILLAAVVAIVLSAADLILQLLLMPCVLLTRAAGLMRWPVQVDREHQFVRTEFADGFDAAAVLRDDLSTQIQRGKLVFDPATTSA